MNKIFVTALALTIAAAAAHSSSARADGFFVDGRIGQSDFKSSGKDTAFGINGGYRWGAFGLEGGYTDLGSADAGGGVNGMGAHSGIDLKGWTAGVNGHFNLNPNWYLSARAGVFHWKADIDLMASSRNAEINGTDWYAGVGVGYDFSERVGVGLNYDRYRAGENGYDFGGDTVSVNTEVRF
jgi:OOP family OmpA-OmpF porin